MSVESFDLAGTAADRGTAVREHGALPRELSTSLWPMTIGGPVGGRDWTRFPSVGTVVGGVIGIAASKAAATRGAVRQKVTEQAVDAAGSVFRNTEANLREATDQATKRYRKAYRRRLRWYWSTYQETVQALARAQRDQQDEIGHRADRLRDAAEEMNRRLADVERQRRRRSDPYATARS